MTGRIIEMTLGEITGQQLKIEILEKCFLNDPERKILTKERKETFKIQMFELIKLLSLYKTNTMYIGFTKSAATVKGYPIFY